VLTHAAVTARLRAAGCVFAEDEATLLCTAPADQREKLLERRVAGEPLEHVLGWARFCGLRIAVAPGVFVPRPRTEFLARQAISLCRPDAVVLDLCCGSGAIGAAIAAARPAAQVHAADVDPAALACARRNLPAGSGCYQGDLYRALPPALRGRVDVLAANVPYVPTGEIGLLPAEARLHEPLGTLDGGPDGLEMLRRVAAGAAGWLAPGGHLLSETGAAQATAAIAVLAAAGLDARIARCEQLEATVVIGARRPAHWDGASA
jgi:release factor glutamine methyltransferase